MRAFLDTNVFVYASGGPDDVVARTCQSVLAAALDDRSRFVTSTLVIEELLRLELRDRVPGLAGTAVDACDLLSPVLPVTEEVVRAALDLAVPATTGSADRMHIATCLVNAIDTVVSADRAFDGVTGLRRVDPFDERATARLLR